MWTLDSLCFVACVVGVPLAIDQLLLDEGVELLMHAVDLSQMSEEKFCLWMGVDRAQFARQCQGIGHISLTRLFQLPPRFWGWYGLLIVTKYGLPKEMRRAARVTVAVFGMKKIARAFADGRKEHAAC